MWKYFLTKSQEALSAAIKLVYSSSKYYGFNGTDYFSLPNHMTAANKGTWRLSHASSETCQASRLHLFKLLLIQRQRGGVTHSEESSILTYLIKSAKWIINLCFLVEKKEKCYQKRKTVPFLSQKISHPRCQRRLTGYQWLYVVTLSSEREFIERDKWMNAWLQERSRMARSLLVTLHFSSHKVEGLMRI